MAAETALQTTEQNEAAAADYGADPKGESSIPAAVVAFRCDMKLLRPLYSAMLVQVLRLEVVEIVQNLSVRSLS